jgi:hypothetical protein
VPEPIDWPAGTPDHIRNPIPHHERCACGDLLTKAERERHECPVPTGAGMETARGGADAA